MDFDPYPSFSKLLGPPARYAQPSGAVLDGLKSSLGSSFADVVSKDGLAFYKQQRLRTVAPADFADVAGLWPLDGEVGQIFMITCFGDFFCWRGGYCWFVDVHELFAVELIDDMNWFLGSFLQSKGYLASVLEGFASARSKLKSAPLDFDEMLAWTPMLSLGGSREESTLEKVKIRESHALLSATGALQLHRY